MKLLGVNHKVIRIIISILLVLLGLIVFIVPPTLFPDPSMGFHVLRSMQAGAPFNVISSPNQNNISDNYHEFLTWWSPGQYLVPSLIVWLFQLSLGKAIAICITLANFLGLAGFYFFFKKIGFTAKVAAISLMLIIAQQAFIIPYINYNGGELLIFSFEGWFLFGCFSIKKFNHTTFLFLLLSGWIGFFLKSSFIWMYGAGLLSLWYLLSVDSKKMIIWLKNGVWIGIPAIISLAFIQMFFLSKGQSPVSVSTGLKLTLTTFSFPLAAPLLSFFSVDELLNGLIFHTGKPIIEAMPSLFILIFFTLLSLVIIRQIISKTPNKAYGNTILIFYVVAILFFGIAYLRQLNVSMEARHFRILGILIIPGIIFYFSKVKKIYGYLFSLILIIIFALNGNYLIKGFFYNKEVCAHGITGIAQPNIDQPSLNKLMKLDAENTNAIFVFINTDLGLEIKHNRVITLPPIDDNLRIDSDDYTYEGHAGPLYILLPANYQGPKETMIMKSFTGYKGFDINPINEKYTLYSAK